VSWPATTWSSWHLHTRAEGQAALDRIVAGVVGPAAALLRASSPPRPWFFMRYWQAGPHVRLRVGGVDEAFDAELHALLVERLSSVNAAQADRPQIDVQSYRAGAAMLAAGGEGGHELEVDELLAAGVHRARYEPELERYGGAELIDVSERLFGLSSRLALTVLQRGLPREAFALEALAAAGAALGAPARRERFARASRDSWLRWGTRATAAGDGPPVDVVDLLASARGLVDRIEAAGLTDRILETENEPIRLWRDELAKAVSRWPEPDSVLASHTHMLLNRLGLGPQQEVLLHTALSESLRRRRTGRGSPPAPTGAAPPAAREPGFDDLTKLAAGQLAARPDDRNHLHVLRAGSGEALLVLAHESRDVNVVAGAALGRAVEPVDGAAVRAWAVLSGPSDAPAHDPWTEGALRPRRVQVHDPELAALALGLDGMDRVVHEVWALTG
jgi:thiopeptide-type bacteriocin biosynthesis protein